MFEGSIIKIFKQKHLSRLKEKNLLLAISGGIDSMVMLDLLAKAHLNLSIAHCNFKLRGLESDQDELFVKDVARQYGIQCFNKNFKTKELAQNRKESIQLIARELRYNWFSELLKEHDFDYVLTAHHLNDSIENFLFYAFRGTGIRGLTGIPEVNNRIVRPLSDIPKEAIKDYATKNSISWREDSSNGKQDYKRNKIRHAILPVLKQIHSDYQTNFLNTKNYLQDTVEILTHHIEHLRHQLFKEKQKNVFEISLSKLKKLNPLKPYLFELFQNFGFKNSLEINRLIEGESGKILKSDTHLLTKSRHVLILKPYFEEEKKEEEVFLFHELPQNIDIPICLEFSKVSKINSQKPSHAYFDEDKLNLPLSIKKVFYEKNDYFWPIGLAGKKTIKKFLKDEKLSLLEKEEIWGLFSGKNLAWIIGHRIDERFKVTEDTKHIIQVELIKR